MESGSTNTKILETIFFSKYSPKMRRVEFLRDEMVEAAAKLKLKRPKNLGAALWEYRYQDRTAPRIRAAAPKGEYWVLLGAGSGRYAFTLSKVSYIIPTPGLKTIEILDSTPGLVARYALNDEQALLAKLRYNRLIDTFTGVTCYSLQNHLRTRLPDVGQIETDEIYVGVDKKGIHHVFPVQAKGGSDKLNVAQIDQDFGVGEHKFPGLICRPMAAQFMDDDKIAIFEFKKDKDGIRIASERHYKLVADPKVSDR